GLQGAFFLGEIEERDVLEGNVVEIEIAAKVQLELYKLRKPSAKNTPTGNSPGEPAQGAQQLERGMRRIMDEIAPVAMLGRPCAREDRRDARGTVAEHRGQPPPGGSQPRGERVVAQDFPSASVDEY